jgi:hypothetical protein
VWRGSAQIKYYRSHEAERMAIVKRAALLVQQWHTYKLRANYIAAVTWSALQKQCLVYPEETAANCRALHRQLENLLLEQALENPKKTKAAGGGQAHGNTRHSSMRLRHGTRHSDP